MNKAAQNVYVSILNGGDQRCVLDTMQTRDELALSAYQLLQANTRSKLTCCLKANMSQERHDFKLVRAMLR
jgi:hypothetical protein